MNTFKNWIIRNDVLFYVVVGILYYLYVRQYMVCYDDMIYPFINGFAANDNPEFVSSISDAIYSQIGDYCSVNGRFLIHILGQTLLGVFPIEVYFVLSSIVFVLLVIGITKLIRIITQKHILYDKAIALLCLLLLLPAQGTTIGGCVIFSVIYLYAGCANIWLFVLWYKYRHFSKASTWQNILIFIVTLIIASLQESFTLFIFCGLFSYYIFNWQELKNKTVLIFLSGFVIGMLILCLAPGNFVRIQKEAGLSMSIVDRLNEGTKFLISLIRHENAVTYLIIAFLYAMILHFKTFWAYIKLAYPLIITLIASAVFACYFTCAGYHQLTIIGLMSTILICSLMIDIVEKKLQGKYHSYCIYGGTILILIVMYIPIMHLRYESKRTYDIMYERAINNNGNYFSGIEHETFWDENKTNYFIRYCNTFSQYTITQPNYSRVLSRLLSQKYGSDHFDMILPEPQDSIVAYCERPDLQITDCLYKSPHYHYLIATADTLQPSASFEFVSVSSSHKDKIKDYIMRRTGKPSYSRYVIAPNAIRQRSFIVDDKLFFIVSDIPRGRKIIEIR